MAQTYEINATTRDLEGSANARRQRRGNQIPAVVYGGKKEPVHLLIDTFAMNKSIAKPGFATHILTLKHDSGSEKVILKHVQWHPARTEILHVDMMRINTTETMTMSVPLKFVGGDVAPGVKKDGGVVSHMVNALDIKCLPKDLPESIEIDLSAMEMGQVLHMRDVALPKGVELQHPIEDDEHNFALASIHAAKIAEVETEAPVQEGLDEEAGEADSDKASS